MVIRQPNLVRLLQREFDKSGPGCICEVLWDTGKAYAGYCVGLRGWHDLLAADPSFKTNKITPQVGVASPRTRQGHRWHQDDSRQAPGVKIQAAIGYLGTAPPVSHAGGMHIWSTEGPLFR